MAKVVLGLGTSHSPQLSTPPEMWPARAEQVDRVNPELLDNEGDQRPYDELERRAPASLVDEITLEKIQSRFDACQAGIARVGEILAETAPDILLMVGDDQEEVFEEDNMPALLLYWGDEILNKPRVSPTPAGQVSDWGYGEKRAYPVASDLSKHLIEYLIAHGFDVAHSRKLAPGKGIGHAFGFVYRRIMNEHVIPTVPVMLNTYYPPNQPTPKRCYELGRALRRGIESWDSDARVAVIGSGGLSHFVINEKLDRKVLKALEEKDVQTLTSLPTKVLNSGTSEIRNWVTAAGAVEHLNMKLIDYVPCYRSRAGTGCAMAFAQWS
jgi:3-O-methylgallate 3,4-dioxygenase